MFLVMFVTFFICPKLTSASGIQLSVSTQEFTKSSEATELFGGQILGVTESRSGLECASLCSENSFCVGVNVCPDPAANVVKCTLIGSYGPSTVATATFYSCYSLRANGRASLPTTTEMPCQNGGTASNAGGCDCIPPFTGDRCQRFMYDCTEGASLGLKVSDNGAYFIQPATAPAPFQVQCDFSEDATWVIQHTSTYPVTSTGWDAFKTGFGNITVFPNPTDFHIGLDQLHHLTSQARYDLHLYLEHPAFSCYYRNFSVGDEATSFALIYDLFESALNGFANDGFSSSQPVVFSTFDRDVNNCTHLNGGAPGWYGQNCSGYNLYADPVLWPRFGDGTQETVEKWSFALIRVSDVSSTGTY